MSIKVNPVSPSLYKTVGRYLIYSASVRTKHADCWKCQISHCVRVDMILTMCGDDVVTLMNRRFPFKTVSVVTIRPKYTVRPIWFRTAVTGRIEWKRMEFVMRACVGDFRNEKIFELNVTQNRCIQMSINRYLFV